MEETREKEKWNIQNKEKKMTRGKDRNHLNPDPNNSSQSRKLFSASN